MSDLEALLRWYLTLTIVTAALFPVVAWLGAPLGSVRYGLVRPLGIVLLTALVWWPAAVLHLPFSRTVLAVALVLVAGAGWIAWSRSRFGGFDPRALIAFEALWLVMFLGYAWFRAYQPDIINTEKPMEIAFLSSISRSDAVPAPDPWFAGRTINYYYFGYQVFGSVIKLSGIPAAIGFNLALASLFASTAVASAAAAAGLARLARPGRGFLIGAAVLAVTFVLLAGNLETARRLIDDPRGTIAAGWWDGVGWQASRVVVDRGVHEPDDERETINEFPAFSFVLGDLHPHVLTYPLLASVLALAVGLASGREGLRGPRLFAVGGLVGLLYASNSWDAPVGLLLVAGAITLGNMFCWRASVRDIGVVILGAALWVAPFVARFDAPVGVTTQGLPGWLSDLPILGAVLSTFGVVTWRPSSVWELITVHGLWIASFVLFAAVHFVQYRDLYSQQVKRHAVPLAVAALVGLLAAIAWAPALIVIGMPFAAAAWLAVRSRDRHVRIVSGIFAIGFLLAVVPEFLYIQDVFADRMNTVFKLYFQAWLLLAVASAGALILIIHRVTSLRYVIGAIAGLAIAATLTYTPLSAWDWTNGFAERYGLDGSDFIERLAPGDAAALAWVREHARPGDTIVESPGCSYVNVGGVPMNRASAFTGVPTAIGWMGHEYQWRRGQDEQITSVLDNRADQANAVLNGELPPSATGARFVVLGSHERFGQVQCDLVPQRGATAAQALAEAGWTVAFESDGTYVFARSNDPVIAGLR